MGNDMLGDIDIVNTISSVDEITNITAAENNHFILLKWGEDIHKEA